MDLSWFSYGPIDWAQATTKLTSTLMRNLNVDLIPSDLSNDYLISTSAFARTKQD